ncbi:MAG: MBOAT family O-acyltransferase, partial [Bacteroidota bacterium]
WGLFKKVVIADNCAEYVNLIFANPGDYSGSTLALGAFLFAFQIYGDFSGYSDIAIGTARLLGINLMKNFAFPFFSRDIAEFWRRWHISLSSWFRDYLYIPSGGSREGSYKSIRNIFLIFLISGFWHGANWTFLFWGFFHALLFFPLFLGKRNRKHLDIVAKGKLIPSGREFFSILSTFILTTFAWIFFRAEHMGHAWVYLTGLFSPTLFSLPEVFPLYTLALILFFISIEWLGREQEYAIEGLGLKWLKPIRWSFYLSMGVLIFLFSGTKQAFIYFQF